jgi:CSLREA domain-containing protein
MDLSFSSIDGNHIAIVYSTSWDQRVIASQDEGLPAGYRLVTKTADTNDGVCNSDCSLREALSVAASGDTVIFDSATFSTARTITLGSQLLISRGVKIIGPGARFLTITAGSGHHIFRLSSATSTVIDIQVSGMTLANANVQLQTDEGGAVQVLAFTSATFREVNFMNNIGWGGAAIYSTGALTLIDCSVVNNAPIDHGAIWITGGTANIANTTIGGNTAVSAYGGMVVDAGTVTMNNVTIAHNQGSTRGGVSVAAEARVILRNTIIANNRTPAAVPSDVLGVFSSYSNNLIGVNQNSNFLPGLPNANDDYVGSTTAFLNPQLGPLANNGGPTDTYALLSASPAINRGQNCVTTASCFTANPSVALAADQRGDPFPRFVQSAVDIGAFEYGAMAVTNTDDTGAGSLRNAIANVPLGGAIGFSIPPSYVRPEFARSTSPQASC